MNTNVQIATFKEENGYVIGLQPGRTVADVHPYPVEQMVAMGFDNQLAVWAGNLTEQGSKGCLRAGMKMYLRLL